MVWYGMVWYGMVWYGMVCHGMVWHGMVPNSCGSITGFADYSIDGNGEAANSEAHSFVRLSVSLQNLNQLKPLSFYFRVFPLIEAIKGHCSKLEDCQTF